VSFEIELIITPVEKRQALAVKIRPHPNGAMQKSMIPQVDPTCFLLKSPPDSAMFIQRRIVTSPWDTRRRKPQHKGE
jgi:hypothetical protein